MSSRVGVVGGGARAFVGGGCVGDRFLHGRVSVFVAKEEAQIPLGHRPCPHLLLPKPPAERCETSTFSLRRRRSHLPVLLPVHTTTKQHPSLRQRLG